jgi:hypothetical protein
VHLFAPGVDITSTGPGGTYRVESGTSMATPHVTGAAALLWSYMPGATYSQIKAALLNSVDIVPGASESITGVREAAGSTETYQTGILQLGLAQLAWYGTCGHCGLTSYGLPALSFAAGPVECVPGASSPGQLINHPAVAAPSCGYAARPRCPRCP